MSRSLIKQKASTRSSTQAKETMSNSLAKIKNKSIFETVVVTDFISNPEDFLDQQVIIPEIITVR